MLKLQTILQNAVEDYLTALDRPITLIDAEEVCSFNLSTVFWDAFNEASATRKCSDPTINGVKQSKAKEALENIAQNLFQNTVAHRYGNLKQLFKDAKTYGFEFSFGTREGLHTTLPEYSEDDNRVIIAYSLTKK